MYVLSILSFYGLKLVLELSWYCVRSPMPTDFSARITLIGAPAVPGPAH